MLQPMRLRCRLRMTELREGAPHCGISDTVRFVFGHLNYHNQIPFRDKCRGDAYGRVFIRNRSVRGLTMPSRTLLDALYIFPRVSNLFVLMGGLW